MYKETVFSREDLHSAMDALDRLGKEYTIKKMSAMDEEVEEEVVFRFSIDKEEKPELFDRWVIEETSTNAIKETFYCDHETTVVVKG